jgi:IMP dehydrogenase
MIADGESARELFGRGEGLAYNDFILLPGRIDFAAEAVDLSTRITRRVPLKVPIVSSPMDTVTEHKMAISLALMGGIGIIHYNNTIDEQVAQVRKVKRFENGFITDPIVLGPNHRIRDIDRIRDKEGFSGIPITEDGTLRTRLVGIVTNRDIDFEPNRDRLLKEVMVTSTRRPSGSRWSRPTSGCASPRRASCPSSTRRAAWSRSCRGPT